jgi:hypothetical protein
VYKACGLPSVQSHCSLVSGCSYRQIPTVSNCDEVRTLVCSWQQVLRLLYFYRVEYFIHTAARIFHVTGGGFVASHVNMNFCLSEMKTCLNHLVI